MKSIIFIPVLFLCIILTLSCQKELNFDNNTIASTCSLNKNAAGNCLPATVNGIYKVGTVLTNTNSVDVQLEVNQAGNYEVKSDTVNRFSYRFSGNVSAGISLIRLFASGNPLAAGSHVFTIRCDTNQCSFTVTTTTPTAPPAVYTIGGAPGTCTGVVLSGTYTVGVPLTAANTAQINVNVTIAGTYSISTTIVNGISFSASGTFATTGPQNVILVGAGTPTASGTFNFPVTGNANTCTFQCTSNAIPPPANTDYIPETINSNWSYRLVGGTLGDTTYDYVSNTTSLISGQLYRHFFSTVGGSINDSSLHRKAAGKYYQYIPDNYGVLDNPVNAEVLLLDSTLAVNGTWTINLPPNSIFGMPVNIRIDAQITAKGATATVAGNGYANVIKVKFNYMLDFGTGYVLYAVEEAWYARGKGMIYDKQNDVPVTTTIETEATRVQIF